MLADHLRRGGAAGLVGGGAYGLFLGTVGRHLVVLAEQSEAGGTGGNAVAGAASLVGGLVWGVVLGVVAFGVGYYLLEPAIPGPPTVRSYVLAAAGFVTVSGAPWLVLPPQPPGVEQALPTQLRLGWYAGMAVAGAIASGFAVKGYVAVRRRHLKGVLSLAVAVTVLAVPTVLAPTNPTTGPAPPALVAAFRWTTVFGQAMLWFVMATVHTLTRNP